MQTITQEKGCRNRYYYVIIMPINKDGQGPCDNHEIDKIKWQVWDQALTSYGEYDFLPDAIDHAEELNALMLSRMQP